MTNPISTTHATERNGGVRFLLSAMREQRSRQLELNLRYLNDESSFIESHSITKARQVRFNKLNEAWLVRFLPVSIQGRWFARHGLHGLQQTSITCPRWVSPDFGGDPDAECPVCELALSLSANQNKAVSESGQNLCAKLRHITYCLVFKIDPGLGEMQEQPQSEILKPWVFEHDQTSFVQLMDYFRRGAGEKRPNSVLDLERGNDFWATKTKKGICLDRQDASSALNFGLPGCNADLDRIINSITQPAIKVPTREEMKGFALSAESAAYAEHGSQIFCRKR